MMWRFWRNYGDVRMYFKMGKNWFLILGLFVAMNGAAWAQQSSSRLPKLSDYEITKALETQEIANFPLSSNK